MNKIIISILMAASICAPIFGMDYDTAMRRRSATREQIFGQLISHSNQSRNTGSLLTEEESWEAAGDKSLERLKGDLLEVQTIKKQLDAILKQIEANKDENKKLEKKLGSRVESFGDVAAQNLVILGKVEDQVEDVKKQAGDLTSFCCNQIGINQNQNSINQTQNDSNKEFKKTDEESKQKIKALEKEFELFKIDMMPLIKEKQKSWLHKHYPKIIIFGASAIAFTYFCYKYTEQSAQIASLQTQVGIAHPNTLDAGLKKINDATNAGVKKIADLGIANSNNLDAGLKKLNDATNAGVKKIADLGITNSNNLDAGLKKLNDATSAGVKKITDTSAQEVAKITTTSGEGLKKIAAAINAIIPANIQEQFSRLNHFATTTGGQIADLYNRARSYIITDTNDDKWLCFEGTCERLASKSGKKLITQVAPK